MVEIYIGPLGTVHVEEASTATPILIGGNRNPNIAQLFGAPADLEPDLTETHLPTFSLKAALIREDNIVGRSIHNERKRNRGHDPRYKNHRG